VPTSLRARRSPLSGRDKADAGSAEGARKVLESTCGKAAEVNIL
jgi:hypothetical protein